MVINHHLEPGRTWVACAQFLQGNVSKDRHCQAGVKLGAILASERHLTIPVELSGKSLHDPWRARTSKTSTPSILENLKAAIQLEIKEQIDARLVGRSIQMSHHFDCRMLWHNRTNLMNLEMHLKFISVEFLFSHFLVFNRP